MKPVPALVRDPAPAMSEQRLPAADARDSDSLRWVDLAWRGRTVRIEHQWIGAARADAPLIVFLHEGLGSVAMWKDFPQRLCHAVGARGLVYSRPGYGRSTPRAAQERWAPDFMHQQALEVLPALLNALGIDVQQQRPWLLGHSDGASIALLYAAHHPKALAGAVLLAPHIFVEPISTASIAQAKDAYTSGVLRERLARYHDDTDSAFWGWCDIWLDPRFRAWSIAEALGRIACPLAVLQGQDDEYGTLAQVDGIAQQVPHARLHVLPDCGHSPHRDQPEAVVVAVKSLLEIV